MAPRNLSTSEITELPTEFPAWRVGQGQLTREIDAPTFPIAIGWVVEIAEAAESLGHHPDIDIRWRTLRLTVSTHSAGCLTELDLELVRLIDVILAPGAL